MEKCVEEGSHRDRLVEKPHAGSMKTISRSSGSREEEVEEAAAAAGK